ncbi:dUTP pyrophosphatase [Lacrimispora sp.]|uniref:dUTP pyrophosphatase n=1 Tax=Lacrimispora sp. TaxID=2719234 RepID=UPI00345F912F
MTVKDNELLWAKVKPDAIIPTKKDEDAGYDIYPCFEEDYIIIPPHETKMVPTGIASAFSENYVAVLKERGSTGTKGMAQRCGVIDSGFRNEWFVPITNTTNGWIIISKLSEEELFNKYELEDEVGIEYILYKNNRICRYGALKIIYPYSKAICQALLLPVPKMIANEITYEELKTIESNRGTGMLGSSGK